MKLVEGLNRVIEERLVHFEMPGHKGRIEPCIYQYDVTEIPGTDNLNNPKDIILETMEGIARAFGSLHSFISVNGATGAVYGAMATAFKPGDEIIMQRNSHVSAYDGAFLLGLKPKYAFSDRDLLEQLKELVTEETKGVILTTPSFYGEIIEDDVFEWIVERGLILVVDESHGSHLKLIDDELSSMRYADIVVHSFHKTLPSMTQTAVMHLCTPRFTRSYAQKNLKLFMSTSPNYVLMRSVDIAMDIYVSQGKELMKELLTYCEEFKRDLEATTDFRVIYKDGKQDKTRLLIRHLHSVDYAHIDEDLRRMGIQTEFQSQQGLLLMPSIMNTKEDFHRLLDALQRVSIDRRSRVAYKVFRPEKALEIRQAFLRPSESLSYREALGRVVSEYVIPYPPGSPVLVPGEVMNEELVDYLEDFKGSIVGLEKEGFVNVLVNPA